jgi:polysaccharide biosynthesis protein VpsJ
MAEAWSARLQTALTDMQLEAIAIRLGASLRDCGHAGWDPFDALNSRLFNATPLRHVPLARLAWTQLFKRSPYNLRKFAGVRPSANAVTIALAAEVARREGRHEDAIDLVSRLLRMRCGIDGRQTLAWGYPFPWQAKAFHVPAQSPNIIATAYAVRELMNWPGEADAVRSAASLVFAHFAKASSNGGRFIAYVPHSEAMVHNANLWGAYVLAAGAALGGPAEWRKLAADAVGYSLAAQRDDGSWAYGEAAHHQFVDSFHTGYVLEALHRISRLVAGLPVEQPVQKGLAFYRSAMFEDDGTARYYANSTFPLDANPAAQAVITLDCLQTPDAAMLGRKILSAVIRNLWIESSGRFAYQKTRRGVNMIDYPRWTQIWLRLALSIVLANRIVH